MGTFYSVTTVKGLNHMAVTRWAVASRYFGAWSVTQNGVTAVGMDGNDEKAIDDAKQLSFDQKCIAWVVMNHDDDVLMYWLFKNGDLLDEYNSSPGYFEGTPQGPSGGNAQLLCTVLGVAVAEQEAREILHAQRDRYVFETERHQDLVNLLELPAMSDAVDGSIIEPPRKGQG